MINLKSYLLNKYIQKSNFTGSLWNIYSGKKYFVQLSNDKGNDKNRTGMNNILKQTNNKAHGKFRNKNKNTQTYKLLKYESKTFRMFLNASGILTWEPNCLCPS